MVLYLFLLPRGGRSMRCFLSGAGVPVEHRAARTKPEIALGEIDRVIASGVCFGCVRDGIVHGGRGPQPEFERERGGVWVVSRAGRDLSPRRYTLSRERGEGRPVEYPFLVSPLFWGEVLWAEGKGEGLVAGGQRWSADMSLHGPPCPRCGWP